jgi:hypothetical protein
MVTMLEVYTIEEKRSVVCFLWAKGPNARDNHKDMFSVYREKYLSRKAVHNWGEKRGKRFADEEEVETKVRVWLRQQSNYFCATGFDNG